MPIPLLKRLQPMQLFAASAPRLPQRVREHIREGRVYRANLCQMISAEYRGDPWEFHRALAPRARAPRSAFVEASGMALASFSPEPFLRVRPPDRPPRLP